MHESEVEKKHRDEREYFRRAMLETRQFFERNGIIMPMEKQIHPLKRRIVYEIIREIDAITNYNADILFNEQLVGSYVEDSARNGVCVYDKDEEVRSAAL